MNFKKCIVSILSTVFILINTFYASGVGENITHVALPIKTAIKTGTPLRVFYQTSSYTNLIHINNFLFRAKPWESIPKSIRNKIVYELAFDNSEMNIVLKEISDEQPSSYSAYTTFHSPCLRGNEALSAISKIIKNIPHLRVE